MKNILNKLQSILNKTRAVDFIAPVLLRLYLVPVFWVAANNKWNPLDPNSSLQGTINWFANPDWGLGLPFPELMAYLAWSAEYFGAILLLLGLAVRWISIPLMVTMLVAAFSVHWKNGWQAIHDPSSAFASAHAPEAIERLARAKDILQEHGNYSWLTEYGNFVVLNNGIEFAATYFIMLVTLFFMGAGRYLSIDYWLAKKVE
ncbi:DoxX family protein [Methylophaga sp. OBS3]|uniref:HvfX family Cu-binding RiPP maturation protein n=1 Tax=Methylophaga sp. OBS3 TaxID=2991934 RepID=UPI00224FDFEB|nr:DoxX family protein [Methylophaga sp. OBS3]MCX4189329.1 DoxX family protein [Methylophaga sp. OBS3]